VEREASAILALEETVTRCARCPRLVKWRDHVARTRVRRFRGEEYWGRPVPAFGDPDASLVIVGLAPAAHGGNRTGRMFTGDRSGDWLFGALYRFDFANQPASSHRQDGLALSGCFITAALRCPPPMNKPLPSELSNCRVYLRRELELLRSGCVYLALGRIAFQAFLNAWKETGHVLPDRKPMFRHGGEWQLPGGFVLIASYHPSQQNTQTGRLTRPMFHSVFRRARQLLVRTAATGRCLVE
jgi:uracil-DNA glycosylase family 4